MALIHEKMYKGEKINNLSVEEYVDDLANDLVRTYATSTKVTVKIESNVDHLSMNNLVPFSLILNELITNSIQHGFKNHEKGNIEVLLKQTPIGFDLIYRDSGEWIDNGGQESFGLELIDTLNGHFDGVYRKSTSAAGTEYVFNFKIF